MAIPEAGYYYKLQLKTAADLFVYIAWNGVARSDGYNSDYDDYYRWLFIPTGNLNEYWIFNKGAQEGYGQALTLPPGTNSLGQWDFNGEKTQCFELTRTGGNSIKLKLKSNNQLVSTRWRWDLFTWVDKNEDEQRLNLVEPRAVERDDMLASYLFWNLDNQVIKDYFTKTFIPTFSLLPAPQLLSINKFIFINNTSKTIIPAVHHFGCAGVPWRHGMAQCWYANLAKGKKTTFEVSSYLKNANAIWAAIGGGAFVVLTIATAGAAAAVAGAAAVSTAAIVGTVTLAVVDVAVLAFDIVEVGRTIGDAASRTGGKVDVKLLMDRFDIDKQSAIAIKKELGNYVFAVKDKAYEEYLEGWHIHECATDMGFDRSYFGSGKAIFIVSDYQVEGIWRGETSNSFQKISKTNTGLSVTHTQTPTGTSTSGDLSFSSDAKVANVYSNTAQGKYIFTSRNSFVFKEKNNKYEEKFRRIYKISGVWQQEPYVPGSFLQRIKETKTGLQLIPFEPLNAKSTTYERTSANPNNYRNDSANFCSFTSDDQFVFSKEGSLVELTFRRVCIEGTYKTNFKNLTLKWEGNHVIGTYDWKDGKVKGTFDGLELKGTWTEIANSGNFILKFQEDCSSFQGLWNYKNDPPKMAWNGTRIQD